MGEDAEDTLASTHIPADDRKDYAAVLKKFDDFFKVRRNVIFERAKFNRRVQLDGESAEQFITSLYSLVETCEYGDLTEEMIRDRIVVGIRDQALAERLQTIPDLTLEKAKTHVRQREAVHAQQLALNSTAKVNKSVDFVGRKPSPMQSNQPKKENNHKKPPKVASSNSKCTRCGRAPHARQQCPARDAECHRCHKRGHFSSQCFAKSVGVISHPPEVVDDLAFLNTIHSDKSSVWICNITVNGIDMPFKVDTGAEVTVISEDYATKLSQEVQPPSKHLHGPDSQPLKVTGEISTTLTYKGKQTPQSVFVVHNLQHNLLGLPAIRALEMLTSVDTVSLPIKEQFPALFSGLGNFQRCEYNIQLAANAKPFALYTPRNVPLPLRDKVKTKLERMEKLGVIAPVEEPTEWCSGMVVVPKKSREVRICVDYRALNESVLREVHPLPTVDETLAQLSGAILFSKLDANCGFWQINLSEACQKLTTFITPFGIYLFKRLPFSISSTPEFFQKQMSAILAGQDGILCHMDDVFIFGSTREEHDIRLQGALKKIQNAGVTLNSEKCEFAKTSITFLGHVIDQHGVSADPAKTQAVVDMDRPTNISELRRFMGMVNQLGKFSSKRADLSTHLRALLSPRSTWLWE
jgi:hypothetical protein